MTECIDRDAFLTKERAWYCKNCIRRTDSTGKVVYEIGEAPCRACEIGDVLNALEDYPAADVRPVVKAIWKHVQWVVDEEWQEGGYWISRCSNCSMPYHTETPFCPHCGADMREET